MKNYNMTMQAKKSRKVHKAKNILDEKCEFSHILWGTIIHHSFFLCFGYLKKRKDSNDANDANDAKSEGIH